MTYGCGADSCKACYPFQYRCEACGRDFPEPVPNGEPLPTCARCGYDGVDPSTVDWSIADQDEVPQTLASTTD